jgi:hypothetical protein
LYIVQFICAAVLSVLHGSHIHGSHIHILFWNLLLHIIFGHNMTVHVCTFVHVLTLILPAKICDLLNVNLLYYPALHSCILMWLLIFSISRNHSVTVITHTFFIAFSLNFFCSSFWAQGKSGNCTSHASIWLWSTRKREEDLVRKSATISTSF